ncbi:MAG: biotin--[acetyl-CoA-carboxylase] ligase [Myxococcota bacterium]
MRGVHHLDETASTNDVARDLAARGAPDGTVVLADRQVAGRGRRGRSWFSPGAGNVYLSYLHRSRLAPERLSGLTLDAATAVAGALEDLAEVRPVLKWPNDVLLGGRKVAGVLTELHTDVTPDGSVAVVVGVGLNVNLEAEHLPAELREVATSLRIETGRAWDHVAVAHLVGRRLGEKLHGYEVEGAPDLVGWRRRFGFGGAEARLGEGPDARAVRIEDVEPDGGLRVVDVDTGATESVRAGEVVVRPDAVSDEGRR